MWKWLMWMSVFLVLLRACEVLEVFADRGKSQSRGPWLVYTSESDGKSVRSTSQFCLLALRREDRRGRLSINKTLEAVLQPKYFASETCTVKHA